MNTYYKTLLPFLWIILWSIQTTYAVSIGNPVFTPINVSHGLSDNQIRYILQLPDGRMVFTTSGNVNMYDGAHFTYLHRSPAHTYSLSEYKGFYHIYLDGDSLLWIKDTNKLMCVDLQQEHYISPLDDFFRQKGVHEKILDFFIDNAQRMWLLTPKGLLCRNTSLLFDTSANQGMLQDLTTTSNCLYLFYSTGSVVCYNLHSTQRKYESGAYSNHQQECFNATSLVLSEKNYFYQLRNGSKGGFFRFDHQKKEWSTLLETDYWLNTLIITPQEVAYISCRQGLWIINLKSGEKQYLPTLQTINGHTLCTELSTIFYDRQGGLWIGTLNRGLLYHHPLRYKFTHIGRSSFPNAALKDISVQAFYEDHKQNVYLRSQTDCYQYHRQKDSPHLLSPVPLSSLSPVVRQSLFPSDKSLIFKGHTYTALCTDSRGWTWAGTSDGLVLFNATHPSGKIFHTEDGLCNNFIHALIEDKRGHIWATTSSGISQIQIHPNTKKVQFINFNALDGTLAGEYMNEAVYELTDGTLLFGGVDGFNVLPSNKQTTPTLPYKPVFTALYLYGEIVKTGKEYNKRIILKQATPYIKELQLSHNQNFITFEFSALNYLNQARTYYRYQLEGLDKQWQERAAESDGILKIAYTNLPPGKYTLKVKASNDGRQWTNDIRKLHLTIQAPWWKTTTAYLIYTLCVVSIFGGGTYLYLYMAKERLKRRHKEEILLLRIRNLIEQCNRYKEEEKLQPCKINPSKENEPIYAEKQIQHPGDAVFLSKAMKLVEQNLNVSGYSVEQLSRDLCMDRTGLYRKLTTLLDQSPSLFIRNIRLQRAAKLLLEGELSISQITEQVGFSSSSYLSKCFQEEFGCRPSEYAEKIKKST